LNSIHSIPPNIFGQFTWFFFHPTTTTPDIRRSRGFQQRNRRGRPFRRPSTPGAAAPTARSDACAARRRAGLSVPDASPALGDSGVGSPRAGTSGLKKKQKGVEEAQVGIFEIKNETPPWSLMAKIDELGLPKGVFFDGKN